MTVDLFGQPDLEAIYQAHLAEPLDRKIDKAIALIREYEPMALDLSPDGYYVAFSGGKDSIVMERLFKMAGVKYQAWYNNVTIDPPELVQFIKRGYPEVRWNNPKCGNLTSRMVKESQGPPTRLARWCCELYKEQGGDGLLKAIGVRADESPRRKGAWTTITTNKRGEIFICPILHWTEVDVWEFILVKENIPYCELYDQGFRRLGCVGCPMSGPLGQARDFKRWPKYEQMWRRGFDAYWKAWKGVPRRDGGDRWIEKFDNVDQLWVWWTSGKAYEGDQPDCQMWLW